MSEELTVIQTEQGNVTLDKKVVKNEIALSEEALMSARSVIVKDKESYIECSTFWKSDKQSLKDTEEKLKSKINPFNEIVKVYRDYFAIPKSNYEKSIEIRGNALQSYDDKIKAQVDAENARLRAIAEKEAEKLRQKAIKEEAKGNSEKANAMKEESLLKSTLVPTVQAEEIKIDGQRSGTEYFAEVLDMNKKMFVEWCLKSENLHFLDVSTKELKITARSARGTRTIPGVRFWSETTKKGCR